MTRTASRPSTFSRRNFALGTAGSLAAINLVAGPISAAQFEFKCGTVAAASGPVANYGAQMWKAVEQETGGRLRVQFFPNSQLGGDDAMLTQLRAEALHFHLTTFGTLAAVVPLAGISYVGFAYNSVAEGIRVMEGPLGDSLVRESAAKNIHMFKGFWDNGMGHLAMTKKPIRTPDDLTGTKPRVSGNRISVDLFKVLGASPSPLATAEVYPGLQTSLVDGVATALPMLDAAKWYELCKYVSLTNHIWFSELMLASPAAWKSLPPDIQAVVERNNKKYAALEVKDIFDNDGTLTKKLTAAGLTFNPVDQGPFRARLSTYYKEWAGTFGQTAWGQLQAGLGRQLT